MLKIINECYKTNKKIQLLNSEVVRLNRLAFLKHSEKSIWLKARLTIGICSSHNETSSTFSGPVNCANLIQSVSSSG